MVRKINARSWLKMSITPPSFNGRHHNVSTRHDRHMSRRREGIMSAYPSRSWVWREKGYMGVKTTDSDPDSRRFRPDKERFIATSHGIISASQLVHGITIPLFSIYKSPSASLSRCRGYDVSDVVRWLIVHPKTFYAFVQSDSESSTEQCWTKHTIGPGVQNKKPSASGRVQQHCLCRLMVTYNLNRTLTLLHCSFQQPLSPNGQYLHQ